MELPVSIDANVKEEVDLTASASSSSRLNNRSSSSRRLRPPLSPLTGTRNKNLGNSEPLFAAQSTYSEIFRILPVSLPLTNDRPGSKPVLTSSQVYKTIKAVILLWKWFCLAYFSLFILDMLRLFAVGWWDSRFVEDSPSSPESILSTLTPEHRLSKISTLYPIPLSFQPFALGPRVQENSTVACLWTDEANLSLIQQWTSTWSGPVSLLVTHSTQPFSLAHKELYSRLTSLSEAAPGISFHILHTPYSLRNFNAYINLARLFSPSSKVLVFPPSSLDLWMPSPRPYAMLSNAINSGNGQSIIPMLPLNVSNADMSRNTFLPSSAVLLDRDSAPWCNERIFTNANNNREDASKQVRISNAEMGFQWQECIWNIYLRSHGEIKLLDNEGWANQVTAHTRVQTNSLLETPERNFRGRLARKQRSETCFLVAREIISLGQWFVTKPMPPLSELGGTEEKAEITENIKYLGVIKQDLVESLQATWMRTVCRETLERWGRELTLE